MAIAMPDKNHISEAEFVSACSTVAAVIASAWWNERANVGTPMKRPSAAIAAAMDCQTAAKYCGFGRTKFRQLVSSGIFPRPVIIEGRKRWLAKDLDGALARMGKRTSL
jgi:hypothetical protein